LPACAGLLVVLVMLLGAAGCSQEKPSDPFFGAPRVSNRQVRSIPMGTPQREVYRRLGGKSPNGMDRGVYKRSDTHEKFFEECWDWPVRGTEYQQPDGGTAAIQWELCFRHGRLGWKELLPRE
jgi:hypothetical protein